MDRNDDSRRQTAAAPDGWQESRAEDCVETSGLLDPQGALAYTADFARLLSDRLRERPPRPAVAEERVLVVPTSRFHALGHFQGFSADMGRYLPALLDGD